MVPTTHQRDEPMRNRATAALQNIYLTLVSFICSLAFGYLLSTLEMDRLFGAPFDPAYG
jgi:hypothetical protein